MKYKDAALVYSPTDLTKFIDSKFSSWMDRKALLFSELNEQRFKDESMKVLSNKGIIFEKMQLKKMAENQTLYNGSLKQNNDNQIVSDPHERTINAMRNGYDIIYQASLRKDNFEGFADFLVKQPGKSNFGDYYYTVKDTKLSRIPKAKFLIQLCAYAEMLEVVQGVLPEFVYVILGDETEVQFKLTDYYHYYLKVKEMFSSFQDEFDLRNQPLPQKGESFGDWEIVAKNILKEANDISLLANISATDVKALRNGNINTLKELETAQFKDILGIKSEKFERIKQQAIVQQQSSDKLKPKYKVLPHHLNNPKGLMNLPLASENDIFIKIDFSSIADKQGLYFQYSIFYKNKYFNFICLKKVDEFKVFNDFLSKLEQILSEDEHSWKSIYGFGFDQLVLINKICSKNSIRLDLLEDIKRRYVDISLLLKQSVVIGVEEYSLVQIERLFSKTSKLIDNIILFDEYQTEDDMKKKKIIVASLKKSNLFYLKLLLKIKQWLNLLQKENEYNYIPYDEREEKKLQEVKELTGNDEIEDVSEILLEEFNQELYDVKPINEKIDVLMKQFTKFHDHEDKPAYQNMIEKFKLLEEDWFEDLECLAFLYKESQDSNYPNRILYSFDSKQDCKLKEGDTFKVFHNKKLGGKINSVNYEKGFIELEFPKKHTEYIKNFHRISIIAYSYINKKVLKDSIEKTFSEMDDLKPNQGLKKCIYDFLSKRYPDVIGIDAGHELYKESDNLVEKCSLVIENMNETSLVIQGPPGAGKTFTSGNAIINLLKKGKKIAITSNSHKAINNLMIKIDQLSKGANFNFAKVTGKEEEDLLAIKSLEFIPTASKFDFKKDYQIVGGTSFTFSNKIFEDYFDYIFIDEAGQFSLANLVAISRCCKNIVLIGDQMQLDQPLQAEHPGESGLSTLEYYLQEYKTIPRNLGFFLPESRRMHPDICSFISDCFYENRLNAYHMNSKRHLLLQDNVDIEKDKGISFYDIKHKGNVQYSIEEIEKADILIKELLKQKIYIDNEHTGEYEERNITMKDIIFVAPYNLQVLKVKEKISGLRAGSVDLFQGQEAPIVIISMCSSDGLSGRGLEFLLSENRMNVAISRGKCLAIVLGNSDICKTKTTSIESIRLLNMYCKLIKV